MRRGMICGLGLLLGLLLYGPAAAVEFGPYLEGAGGGGRAEWDSDLDDWEVSASSGTIGFALDSAPIGPQRFAYRLNVGIGGLTLVDEDGDKFLQWQASDDVELAMGGISVENFFTFALINKPRLRWWAGPLLGFGFYSGESDRYWLAGGGTGEVEARLFAFDIGGATGVNLPLGKIILAPTAGFRYVALGGEGERRFFNTVAGTFSEEDDFAAGLFMSFFNVAVLF